ncbi:MAG: spermidine synthase [Betaproteobacteria bacterium]|nr:spermidine synthase [Betaproteobacteria bacterium]
MNANVHSRVPRGVFFLLFTVSGFAGLIYESIWSHYLKLFLGHAAYAQTLVLALFMGGMAIGAWACSRYGLRWANLLVGYAIAEGLIGVAALLFHATFVWLTNWAYDLLLPGLGTETSAALAKWILAGLLILPQSILLGMTFPLMSAGLIRRHPLQPGGSLSMLYFTNSFGAALGVLASGFLLIEKLGLPGTIQLAGALNIALAATVWLLARGSEPRSEIDNNPNGYAPASSEASGLAPGTSASYSLFLAIALLTGAASFIYEIGWIRMLSLVLGASTHSFELMLSAFILGLAFGGLWVKRRIDLIADPMRFLAWVQIAMGLLALATIPVYGQMFEVMAAVIRGLAKTDTGHAMFLGASHGIALVVMFPATFCAGMTLPLITYSLLRLGHGEKSIGAVYASNTLGSILGVFFAAHAGMPLLGLKGLIAVGAALDVTLGLVLLWRVGGRPAMRFGAAATAGLAFAVVLAGFPLDNYKMASGVFRRGEIYDASDGKLISHEDGKTTTVSLMDFPEGRSLRTNGKSDGAIAMDPAAPRISDEVTMVLTAAIPMAVKPDAKNVAVIGIGTGLTTHTMLSNAALQSVDTIEIEPLMANASKQFAPINSNAFADPRSRIVFDDAKTFFSTQNRRYDIIVSEPSNPWVSGVSSLFTREFYQLARRYLKPGGVLVQWFQLYEMDASLLASVLAALGGEFPDYVIYATTNGDLLIVGGEPETLSRPLFDITSVPGVADELRRVQVHTLGDLQMRRIGGRKTLEPFFASFEVPANSDYAPYLDLHASKYRFLQKYAGEVTELGGTDMPVIAMLEGRTADWIVGPSLRGGEFFEKIDTLRNARYARDFIFGKAIRPPDGIPGSLQKDLEIAKLQAGDCRDTERIDLWFHSLLQLARTMTPLLPVVDASAMWNRIASPPCQLRLTESQAAWLELFRAVARRDAPVMASLAEKLLDARFGHSNAQSRYLVIAGMAGHLVGGDKDKAAVIWNGHPAVADKTKDFTLRLLHAHAFAAGKAGK